MDYKKFVTDYIKTSKNINFTVHLSGDTIEKYEKQYDIEVDREFYFDYSLKYNNTYCNNIDEESDYDVYYSNDEYNSSSSNESSDDEIEYY